MATSSLSTTTGALLPSGPSISIVTPALAAFADVTFVAVLIVMPRFLNDFSNSAETASSSFGTMRGRSSMSVTALPNR